MDVLAACRLAVGVGARIRRLARTAVRKVRQERDVRALRRAYLRAEEGKAGWDEYARARKHYWWTWEQESREVGTT